MAKDKSIKFRNRRLVYCIPQLMILNHGTGFYSNAVAVKNCFESFKSSLKSCSSSCINLTRVQKLGFLTTYTSNPRRYAAKIENFPDRLIAHAGRFCTSESSVLVIALTSALSVNMLFYSVLFHLILGAELELQNNNESKRLLSYIMSIAGDCRLMISHILSTEEFEKFREQYEITDEVDLEIENVINEVEIEKNFSGKLIFLLY